MREELKVNIKPNSEKNYSIYITDDEIKNLKEKIEEKCQNRKKLVIFSEKVYKLYKKEINFDKKEVFILKDGEKQKTIKNFERIIQKAIKLNLTRKDLIVAIGGGVVGDVAGFVAATYMRGIEYIQIPTTLLACVDSSVGGKTAIDMPHGKNYVGAFYQPSVVYINLNFLKTLDEKQYKSGFGEILKYAFIEKSCKAGEEFNLFDILKENIENYKKRDLDFLSSIINISLKLKIAVVSQDEKEQGLRKILNFGHTFAHALEEETKYKRYTHGLAVVQGIKFIFNYALKRGFCENEYYSEVFKLIKDYGYKEEKFCCINKKNVLNLMKYDKKAEKNCVLFIVPTNTGEVREEKVSDVSQIEFDCNFQG